MNDIPILLMRLIVIRYNGRGIMVFVKQVSERRIVFQIITVVASILRFD